MFSESDRESLEYLISAAPRMREAGILELKLDGLTMSLLPQLPEPEDTSEQEKKVLEPLKEIHDRLTGRAKR